MRAILLNLFTLFVLLLGLGQFGMLTGLYNPLSPSELSQNPWFWGLLAWGIIGAVFLILTAPLFLSKLYSVRLANPRNQQERWATALLHQQARDNGMPVPALGVMEKNEFQAFTVGVNRSSSCIVISKRLLKSLNQNALEAVLAHELAHVQNGDMRTVSFMQALVYLISVFPARVISFCLERVFLKDKQTGIVYQVALVFFQLFLAWPLTLWVASYSRRQEFAADAIGVKFVGREKMQAALNSLRIQQHLDSPSGFLPAFDKPAFFWQYLGYLFSSHPSLDNRIDALNRKKKN